MFQNLQYLLGMLLAALFLVPPASAQSDRFEEIKVTYQSRDGAAAMVSEPFTLGERRNDLSQAELGRLLPGGISNRGRSPARVVIFLEAEDSRRGFALFSPRRSADVPRNAVPIAHATIPPAV
ncbi:hypothetical protein BH23BAC4_BH23BAC4_17450 [soil metagenome]